MGPDLPDWPERIATLDHILALRGRGIFCVHHFVRSRFGQEARPLADTVIFPWVVGPVVHSLRNGLSQHYMERPKDGPGILMEKTGSFVTENGDWDNAMRRDLTLLNLDDYNVGDTAEDREPASCSAMFETLLAAELWAVHVKLSFTDVDPRSKNDFKRNRIITPRRSVARNS